MGVGLCITPIKTNKESESNKLFNQNLYNINSSIIKYAPKQKIKSNNLSNLKNKNKKVIIKNENNKKEEVNNDNNQGFDFGFNFGEEQTQEKMA